VIGDAVDGQLATAGCEQEDEDAAHLEWQRLALQVHNQTQADRTRSNAHTRALCDRCRGSVRTADKAFVKNIYDALAVDDRNIWVDWEVRQTAA